MAVLGALPAVGDLPRQGHTATISPTSERRTESQDLQGPSVPASEHRAFQQTQCTHPPCAHRITPKRTPRRRGSREWNRGTVPLPADRALGKTGLLSPAGAPPRKGPRSPGKQRGGSACSSPPLLTLAVRLAGGQGPQSQWQRDAGEEEGCLGVPLWLTQCTRGPDPVCSGAGPPRRPAASQLQPRDPHGSPDRSRLSCPEPWSHPWNPQALL